MSDKESFEEIPNVRGLVSYRTDNKKLYVNQGTKWQALSSEQEVSLYCIYDYREIRSRYETLYYILNYYEMYHFHAKFRIID